MPPTTSGPPKQTAEVVACRHFQRTFLTPWTDLGYSTMSLITPLEHQLLEHVFLKPETNTKQTNIPKHQPHIVFWAIGGSNPAHSLRILLIRAGIEQNPGPTNCDFCKRTMRDITKTSHLKCTQQGCNRVCHKQKSCSQLARAALGTAKWFCSSHNSVQADPPAQDTNEQEETNNNNTPDKCSHPSCKSNLKQNPIVCTECGGGFHQRFECSGLPNRYAVAKARPT